MPTIAEAFDEDLVWARGMLPGMAEYPVLDALPFVDGKPVLHRWTLWSEWEDVLAECHRRVVDSDDFATRFVAVTWAYRIWASQPDSDKGSDPLDLDPELWEIEESRARLTDLVGLRRPDESGDARESAWELVCRCAIQDWEGARAFLERFVSQASIAPRDARALRGQLGAMLALVLTGINLFLSIWKPRLDTSLLDGAVTVDGSFGCLRPLLLLLWGLKPEPLPLNDELRLAVADAAHELDQANRLERLPIHYRAFMARAFANAGRREEAATLYRAIADEAPWNSLPEFASILQPGMAEALEAAGDPQRAVTLLEEFLRGHKDTRLSLRLAKLYIESECDHRKAFDLLERAVKEDPALGSEPAIDVGLALGRLGIDAIRPEAMRQALGGSESTRAVARGLLPRLVSRWERLKPESQEELIDAAVSINAPDDGSPHAKSRFPWAVVQSAKAVERELQEQLLKPFRADNRKTPPDSERDPIAAFLRRRRDPGVGEMLQALVRPRAAAERQLQEWAKTGRQSDFVKWLACQDTTALTRARTPAVHATSRPVPGEDEALAVFTLAIAILENLPK